LDLKGYDGSFKMRDYTTIAETRRVMKGNSEKTQTKDNSMKFHETRNTFSPTFSP